jgi:hypothetical protein
MKSKLIQTVLFLIVLMVLGCKNDKNTTAESIQVPEGLILNNGQKWITNRATHNGIKHIDSILKNNTISDGKA